MSGNISDRPIPRPKRRIADRVVPRPKVRIADRVIPRAKHVLPEADSAETGVPQDARPDGRLKEGLNALTALAKLREENIDRDKDKVASPVRQRRSGRFRDTLKDA